MPAPFLIIQAAWIAFCVYWIWAARNQKREQKREPPFARLTHVAYMACGFVLLYAEDPRFGALNRRFLPEREWIAMLGAVLTVGRSGLCNLGAPAHWKKLERPGNYPQEHELIRSGPYARIRHPIYTGLLLAVAGTAIAIGEYRAIVAFAVIAIGFVVKARREEAFLATQFGPAFDEHRRQTGFFLPR